MADAKKAEPSGTKPKKKKGRLKFFFFVILAAIAMPFMLPTLFLLAVGLIPTYVAMGTDSDPQKSGAVSVAALNVAGLSPFLIELWIKGQTVSNAFTMIGDANTWLMILGASAIGQMIVYIVPPAIATLTTSTAQARIKALRKNLETLKESWGPDVATSKPVDKIVQN